jgi:NAD(P)-dependent dehydrogenase (short-subunit alcohol dehydrogenase family)
MASDTRVGVVTGAGSGIGRATGRMLATRGYRVALVGRREGPLRDAAKECGKALVIPADVGDAAAARGAVRRAVAELGRLDVLVNNAGVAHLETIDQTTPEILQEAYRVNALGPANMIAEAWPVFARQRSGCVVNVSTIGTVDPLPGFFAYAASKAAVNLMARSCANEGGGIGVRAFAVAPGAVETPMLREHFSEEVFPREACLAPEDVARVILECIEGKRDGDNGGVVILASPGAAAGR